MQEIKKRGSINFPVDFHLVKENHPRYHMPHHWHTEYELIKMIRGTANFTIDTNSYTLLPGDILFVNDAAIHGCTSISNQAVYQCIVFDEKILSESSVDEDIMIDYLYHKIQINEFYNKLNRNYNLLDSLFSEMKNRNIGYKNIFQGQLITFLGNIFRNHEYSENKNNRIAMTNNINRIKNSLSLIHTNYMDNLTLKDLASISGFSDKYFCKIFATITGKTPIEYLNFYRIEKAQAKILKQYNCSITELALSVGYNDVSYFIRTFKKYKGYTPYQFMKRL